MSERKRNLSGQQEQENLGTTAAPSSVVKPEAAAGELQVGDASSPGERGRQAHEAETPAQRPTSLRPHQPSGPSYCYGNDGPRGYVSADKENAFDRAMREAEERGWKPKEDE